MKAYSVSSALTGLGDFLHSEYDPTYTTDTRVVAAGVGTVRVLPSRCLVAAILLGAGNVVAGAAVSASGGAPGNGAIANLTADAGALAGVYHIVVIEPSANGGTIEVVRPDGVVDGVGVVAVAYNGMINFTLPDGATDWVAGDRIPVTVSYAAGSGKLVQWDPTAVNGAQTILGVNVLDQEAAIGVDGDEAPFLARGPIVGRKEGLVWHAGVTDNQKATAYAALAALGIKCVTSG
jgi:hypothetical protein